VVAARCFGITLVALSVACWRATSPDAPAVGGMLLYNAALALYLAYLAVVARLGGPLLWPAAALRAVVAVLLAVVWRRQRGAPADG